MSLTWLVRARAVLAAASVVLCFGGNARSSLTPFTEIIGGEQLLAHPLSWEGLLQRRVILEFRRNEVPDTPEECEVNVYFAQGTVGEVSGDGTTPDSPKLFDALGMSDDSPPIHFGDWINQTLQAAQASSPGAHVGIWCRRGSQFDAVERAVSIASVPGIGYTLGAYGSGPNPRLNAWRTIDRLVAPGVLDWADNGDGTYTVVLAEPGATTPRGFIPFWTPYSDADLEDRNTYFHRAASLPLPADPPGSGSWYHFDQSTRTLTIKPRQGLPAPTLQSVAMTCGLPSLGGDQHLLRIAAARMTGLADWTLIGAYAVSMYGGAVQNWCVAVYPGRDQTHAFMRVRAHLGDYHCIGTLGGGSGAGGEAGSVSGLYDCVIGPSYGASSTAAVLFRTDGGNEVYYDRVRVPLPIIVTSSVHRAGGSALYAHTLGGASNAQPIRFYYAYGCSIHGGFGGSAPPLVGDVQRPSPLLDPDDPADAAAILTGLRAIVEACSWDSDGFDPNPNSIAQPLHAPSNHLRLRNTYRVTVDSDAARASDNGVSNRVHRGYEALARMLAISPPTTVSVGRNGVFHYIQSGWAPDPANLTRVARMRWAHVLLEVDYSARGGSPGRYPTVFQHPTGQPFANLRSDGRFLGFGSNPAVNPAGFQVSAANSIFLHTRGQGGADQPLVLGGTLAPFTGGFTDADGAPTDGGISGSAFSRRHPSGDWKREDQQEAGQSRFMHGIGWYLLNTNCFELQQDVGGDYQATDVFDGSGIIRPDLVGNAEAVSLSPVWGIDAPEYDFDGNRVDPLVRFVGLFGKPHCEVRAACCPADLTPTGSTAGTPDGVVDISDYSFYLTLWASADARADVTTTGTANGTPDGAVDISDFSHYLTLWSAGCP